MEAVTESPSGNSSATLKNLKPWPKGVSGNPNGRPKGFGAYARQLDNEVNAAATLNWDSSGNFLGPSGSKTWQTYTQTDTTGQCYRRTLTAKARSAGSRRS